MNRSNISHFCIIGHTVDKEQKIGEKAKKEKINPSNKKEVKKEKPTDEKVNTYSMKKLKKND